MWLIIGDMSFFSQWRKTDLWNGIWW